MSLALLTWGAISIAAVSPGRDSVPLYDNLGSYHRGITTASPLAQRYFDQGLRLVYAFNHGEAIRAFTEATRRDPECAMCYWGIALAYGPHVNAGMDSAAGVAAYQSLTEARRRAAGAAPVERALIEALAARYAPVPPAERAHLDSAYATAMGKVADRYPNDLDVATLYAEALMDLSPWNYWTRDGRPRPGTETALRQLEKTLARDPNHPGACHYYIHAVEARMPEKAVECAERLAALMPGAGHLVHMPGHIYIRVGRYADAIEANVHAVHADESYIEGARPQGLYPIGYYPHNYHFLAFASTMMGQSARAIEAAWKTAEKTDPEVARMAPPIEPYITYPLLTLVTFGRWDEVLQAPVPPADLPFSVGLANYARGVAFAAKGRWAAADAALDTLQRIAGTTDPRYVAAGWVTPKAVLDIATHALMGEIATRRGELDAGIAHFREAAALEDGMLYVEPPDWYYPIRHSLGAALLKAGRAAEAERVYREDLDRFPKNGWALYGLAAALRAQGKTAEARAVQAEFDQAWAEADVRLTASRF